MKRFVPQFLLSFAAAVACCHLNADQSASPAAEATASPPTNAPVRNVGKGLFEIGSVRLDKNQQTVSFPAVVNLKETAVEYLLVTEYGKIHESILRTETQPYHIHLAMLLLGVLGAGTNTFPKDPALPPPGSPIAIEIQWTSGASTTVKPAETLILHRQKNSPMEPTDWIFNGSAMFEGTFLAQQEGSVVSLIGDPVALVNYPGPERADDENWAPNPDALPDVETMVRVTFRLRPKKK